MMLFQTHLNTGDSLHARGGHWPAPWWLIQVQLRLQDGVFVDVPISSNQSQVVPVAVAILEEQGGPDTAELALRDDGDPVSEYVCFVHVVGGEDDCATLKRSQVNVNKILVKNNIFNH